MKSKQINREPKTEAVYLAASALKRVVKPLSKATAYWVIIVLVTMMTGRLVANKGSLARATIGVEGEMGMAQGTQKSRKRKSLNRRNAGTSKSLVYE